MRTLLTLSLLACALTMYCQTPVPVTLGKGHIYIELPNDKWKPAPETDSTKGVYFFKREAVKDAHGRSIIPAIMLFIEDAKNYRGDVVEYSIIKRTPLMKKGLNVDQTLIYKDKGYPLSYPNAMYMRCSYTQDGIPHLMYMIHIINKYNEGIQFYLDMTKDLGDEYEKELTAALRSIREK